MKSPVSRRQFMKQCISASAAVFAGATLPEVLTGGSIGVATSIDLCAVAGDKYFENTMTAVEALGGMHKFVKKGDTVGILINSVFERIGTFANPDISLAVIKMCLDSGAKSVYTIEDTPRTYWRASKSSQKLNHEIGLIRYSEERRDVKIERGKSLKEATISTTLLSCDVFINIPIVKDHRGTRYTGNLKNMMGACSSSTCRRCHFGDQSTLSTIFQGYYDKVELLAQSIADLNLIRSPDLCVVDATEILARNGPAGPGELKRPMEVVAGTNCVAADMYCVKHLGLIPEDLLVIKRAQEHGLGPTSLRDVKMMAR